MDTIALPSCLHGLARLSHFSSATQFSVGINLSTAVKRPKLRRPGGMGTFPQPPASWNRLSDSEALACWGLREVREASACLSDWLPFLSPGLSPAVSLTGRGRAACDEGLASCGRGCHLASGGCFQEHVLWLLFPLSASQPGPVKPLSMVSERWLLPMR